MEPKCETKCYCSKCFTPVEAEDRVDIDGHPFHRQCGQCSVCRCVPKSMRMFYGHVFCEDCFNKVILPKLTEGAAANASAQDKDAGDQKEKAFPPPAEEKTEKVDSQEKKEEEEERKESAEECKQEPVRMCMKCMQPIKEGAPFVEVGGQCYHKDCCKCCCCNQCRNKMRLHMGQLMCEDCLNRSPPPRNTAESPADFFKFCFDSWKTNPTFAEQMKQFMESGSSSSERPRVTVLPQSCRDEGAPAPAWFCPPDKKCQCENCA